MQKITKLLLLIFLTGIINVWGQSFLGLQSSNYAGTYGLYTQPASVADNRLMFDMNFSGTSITGLNNFIGIRSDSLFSKFFRQNGVPNGQQDNYFQRYENNNKNYAYFNTESYGPLSFMATISKKAGIGLHWRFRAIANVDNVTDSVANLIYSGLGPNVGKTFTNDNARIAAAAFNEFGLTYGREVYNNGKHFVKAGGTFKLMQGLVGGVMYFDRLSFMFPNNDSLNVNNVEATYGLGINADTSSIRSAGNFFAGSFPSGWGADIGVVYEFRPNHENYNYTVGDKSYTMRNKNKYKLKVGLSLLDIGRVTYKRTNIAGDFSGSTQNLKFGAIDFNNFDSTLIAKFNVNTNQAKFAMALPTAFCAQIDYNIYKNLYVNFMPYVAFRNTLNPTKPSTISNFSITPRWEGRFAGIAVPLSIDNNKALALGTTVRVGPFVLGSSNIGSALVSKSIRGADVHFALRLPIGFRPNRDKDGDKVKDKKDECPLVFGEKSLKGCPDKDQDGVADDKDKCPDVAGRVEFEGCPDRDNDGIADDKDRCPDVPGKAEFEGCNDTDGDGIADNKDDCVNTPGKLEFNGCPDTDGDGIADAKDDCVKTPGLKALNGCPDTDGDGIADSKDDCPTVAGVVAFNGCPDTDGDGITDSKDDCPTVAGVVAFNGCPDTDGDGIADAKDNCPKVKGLKIFNGCPDTDEDGVADAEDNCPKVKGLKILKGCPVMDTDGDEILDEDDDCPTVKGAPENKGCPYGTIVDTDGDGVQNKEDFCETIPGPKYNNGCPAATPPATTQVLRTFANLEFDTGKDLIQKNWYHVLESLVTYMKSDPNIVVFVIGNTDNVGGKSFNEKLSLDRAEAVRDYLIKRGIPKEHIITEGRGDSYPIGDNKTPEGRQRNRRVELLTK